MKKKQLRLSLVLVGLILFVGGGYFGWQWYEEQPVSQLELNQTYASNYDFKLLKGNRWVVLLDNSDYEDEDELEEERLDNYPDEVYPEQTFYEGTYKKKGDKYYFRMTKSVTVQFKSVKAVEKKEIFKKYIDNAENPAYQKEPTLAKTKSGYVYRDIYTEVDEDGEESRLVDEIPVNHSSDKLPDSVEHFLKQFKDVANKS